MIKELARLFGFGMSKDNGTQRAKGIVCVERTVYPLDKPRFSSDGKHEWYGLKEN